MLIKFTAKTMPRYAGVDGKGGSLDLKPGDIAEVSDSIAKLLLRAYGANFEVAIEEKPAHAPTTDKLFRKTFKVKTK
jgi:hypothetical protein